MEVSLGQRYKTADLEGKQQQQDRPSLLASLSTTHPANKRNLRPRFRSARIHHHRDFLAYSASPSVNFRSFRQLNQLNGKGNWNRLTGPNVGKTRR